MANILRRIKKLESQVADRCGQVPHTEVWFEHWCGRYEQFLATMDDNFIRGMGLDFIDELVERTNREKRENRAVC